jgi:hypothetical protein
VAAQGDSGTDREFHCLTAQDGQSARKPQTNRADICVRGRAKLDRTTAENLGFGPELYVDLKADDGFVLRRNVGGFGCDGHTAIVSATIRNAASEP